MVRRPVATTQWALDRVNRGGESQRTGAIIGILGFRQARQAGLEEDLARPFLRLDHSAIIANAARRSLGFNFMNEARAFFISRSLPLSAAVRRATVAG